MHRYEHALLADWPCVSEHQLKHNKTNRYPLMSSEFESVNVPGLFFAGRLMHARDRPRSSGGFIHGFRCVSNQRACTPVKLLLSVQVTIPLKTLLDKCLPTNQPTNQPTLDWVVDCKGLTFKLYCACGCHIGELFRYLVRALSRQLAARYHDDAWPSMSIPLDDSANVLEIMMVRLHEASGPYQMFSNLVDVLVLPDERSGASGDATGESAYSPTAQ